MSKILRVGVFTGGNLSYVREHCSNCTGVDINDYIHNDESYFKDFKFMHMSTDDFFQQNTETFDIVFIDAEHNFESAKKDFANSIKVLNKYGIIFLHDTDPMSEELLDKGQCGDSYKMVDWIPLNYPDLNIITLPIATGGLTIVNRKNDRRVLNYIKL